MAYGMAAMGHFSLPGPKGPRAREPAPAMVPARARCVGVDAVLDPTGALYWPAEATLVVSDLHLETGSSYARTGQMLPPYDTGITLKRLADAVARLAPRRIVSLGDSFHDPFGHERLQPADRAMLTGLLCGCEMIWVTGNHDHASAAALGGVAHDVVTLGGITFRHVPAPELPPGEREIAGHLHPAARIVVRGKALKRRCFVACERRMVMPAFGALTGGLPLSDPAFTALWPAAPCPRVHMIGRDRVYPVG